MTAIPANEPIGDINTTPLIDVMLVLLIMLIITIPLQTHNVPMDLPRQAPAIIVNPVRNTLSVTADDRLFWNGAPITEAGLGEALQRIAAQPVRPEVQLEPDAEARYDLVARVLATIKRANITGLGVVGNERYTTF
jgi:biopolymer transport protein ExbD